MNTRRKYSLGLISRSRQSGLTFSDQRRKSIRPDRDVYSVDAESLLHDEAYAIKDKLEKHERKTKDSRPSKGQFSRF